MGDSLKLGTEDKKISDNDIIAELSALRQDIRELKELIMAGNIPTTLAKTPAEDLLHIIATQGAQAGVKYAGRKLKGKK